MFFTGVDTFGVVQENKPVIDAMNWLTKRKKATSLYIFEFSILQHNKLLMVLKV